MRLLLRMLLAAVLVSLAAAAAVAAGSDPFSGTWTSTDLDGSNQRITITAAGSGVWQWDFYDDRATSCGGAPAKGSGSGTVSGNTLAGSTTISCDPGPTLGTFGTRFTLDPGTGKLTDGFGVIWSRVQTLTLEVADAAVRVTWRESRATGTVTGTASEGAQLTLALISGGGSGKTVAQASVRAGSGGAFTGALRLPPSLLPGTFLLRVQGVSGGRDLPPAERQVVVPAPAEGVVSRAYASTKRGGPPVLSISGAAKEIWARFQFAARPSASTVTVFWITPSGQVVGTAAKPYTQTVDTFVGSAAPLQKGTWHAVLKVKGKVVKRVAIKVK